MADVRSSLLLVTAQVAHTARAENIGLREACLKLGAFGGEELDALVRSGARV